ncbi:MAG: C4-dicarboxylate TRAP transporter substrate-binding protein [Syntrophorhabdaceae bacterium]|nr:C4-dicarboxylate TRAP transporter substrate-binding protein [Syntrophorhabdaceae bacterium]
MKYRPISLWSMFAGAVLILAFIIFGLTVAASTSYAASEKPIVLKLSSFLPETGTEGMLGKWWGTELEKRSNGRVKVQYFFAEALVKTMDSLPAVSSGIADVQFFAPGYFPTQMALSGVADLLFQTQSNWVSARAYNEMADTFPPFQKMMKDNNIKLMSIWPASEVVMISRKPIKTLDDLKGKKIRALGLMNKAMKMLGATPVAMPLPEVYEALERGTIDAVTGLPYHLVAAFKMQEAAKNLINPGLGCYASGGYFMNLNTWNKLPDDIKKIALQLNQEFPDVAIKMQADLHKKTTDTLLKAKCNIYSLPANEVAKWKAILIPSIYDDWMKDMASKGLPGKETLQKYQELVKKYTPKDKYVSPFLK